MSRLRLRRRLLGLALIVFGLMLIFNVVNLSALMMISYVDIWNYLYLVFSQRCASNNLELAIGIAAVFVMQSIYANIFL